MKAEVILIKLFKMIVLDLLSIVVDSKCLTSWITSFDREYADSSHYQQLVHSDRDRVGGVASGHASGVIFINPREAPLKCPS